ncbi:MAG TPA: alanine racemase, partial [Phaeodactylibacter sp.]|nr:alanine racemase [Phaeodactylibacter sp.]
DKLLPTIGNICMDVCMVELSGEEDIKVGDEVIIFGDHPKVEDLADCFGTIAYEVFTGVSERVKRVYVL